MGFMKCCYIGIVIFVILFLNAGCKKDNPVSTTGNLVGHAYLINNQEIKMSDNSQITVSVEGTSYHDSTKTDGSYSISNVPYGTHTITFQKNGFTLEKIQDYQFVDGGKNPIYDVGLRAFPTFSIGNLSAVISSGNVSLTVSLVGGELNSYKEARIFISKDSSTVSCEPKFYIYTTPSYAVFGTNNLTMNISFATLYQKGLISGTKIFIVGYPATSVGTKYYDAEGLEVIHDIALHPSNIVGVVVP